MVYTYGVFDERSRVTASVLKETFDNLVPLFAAYFWSLFLLFKKVTLLRDGPLDKLWGGWGILKGAWIFFQKIFPSLYSFFFGNCTNILALLGVHEFFSSNFPLHEYFFALPLPPISFLIVPMFIVSSRNVPPQGVANYDTTAADDRSRPQQHF